jgi:hypothetical protein
MRHAPKLRISQKMCYEIMKMGRYYAYQTTVVGLSDYPLVISHHQVDPVFQAYEMTNKLIPLLFMEERGVVCLNHLRIYVLIYISP